MDTDILEALVILNVIGRIRLYPSWAIADPKDKQWIEDTREDMRIGRDMGQIQTNKTIATSIYRKTEHVSNN